ncbi:hypothetical protein GCM10012275_29130 [Longimycelium tulufanense]|uniref:Uncharacterized protein n=1 Tax=Longimycelium tulufanense TaxID=907463 RepID=A0A8J3CF23_9PSEU|nr:hypothetical protein [Longimycelium tulufanense]GGM56202.1 hypothetical protein GCM10012275_29130 [Longimycelium tulufanense]
MPPAVRSRSLMAAVLAAAVTMLVGALIPASAPTAPVSAPTVPIVTSTDGPRIDLRVLLVTNGTPPVEAIRAALADEGVPTQVVELADGDRPVITDAFLADTVEGTERAKFQAVVLPSAMPNGLAETERTAMRDFQRRFRIREVVASERPGAGTGLGAPWFSGPLDGTTTQVTTNGLAGAWRYLRGPIRFADNDASVPETYGHLANPLPADPTTGRSFLPLLTAPAPGGGQTGVLAGVHQHDGREQLVLTFSYHAHQPHFRLFAHGLISWMTRGVHLGHWRNYFSMHVDDVFLLNSRWSVTGNCTPGSDCPPDVAPTKKIRMTESDVAALRDWQSRNRFQPDLLFNGGGSDEAMAKNGADPLTDAFLESRPEFRWTNHTYSHPYLGCEQDHSTIPWTCATDSTGRTRWVSERMISEEISKNIKWAMRNGLSIRPDELVTGEHSGLRVLPPQPADNPNLAPALEANEIRWLGSDNSRDPGQRPVGGTLTVPRHPVNLFYNVGTEVEEVDQYNWIYTSRADGGSGRCEDNPQTMTCIEPLDPATGYRSHIVPMETRIALRHVLSNDPRPHYTHQSNLAEERLLYPFLDSVLQEYRDVFAGNAPLVNPRHGEAGQMLLRQARWRAALTNGSEIVAYQRGNLVTVRGPDGLEVPVTVPEGSWLTSPVAKVFGDGYAGERSGYRTAASTVAIVLPTEA